MAKSRASSCPTLSLLGLLGKKWTIPIIEMLGKSDRTLQFSEMQHALTEITPKNLSRSLKDLTTANVLKRTETKFRGSLYVGYELTDKGKVFEDFVKSAKKVGICLYDVNPYCANRQCYLCPIFNQ